MKETESTISSILLYNYFINWQLFLGEIAPEVLEYIYTSFNKINLYCNLQKYFKNTTRSEERLLSVIIFKLCLRCVIPYFIVVVQNVAFLFARTSS